jgi:AbrB family looped-hinge helix DNA binding protein
MPAKFLQIDIDLQMLISKNILMSMKVRESSVVFSTRGQVVIPSHIRKEFGIEEGVRAIVYETPEGIMMKPITEKTIRNLYGKYRHLPLMEKLAELKKEEKER